MLTLVIIFQMGTSVIKKEKGVKNHISAWADGETICREAGTEAPV